MSVSSVFASIIILIVLIFLIPKSKSRSYSPSRSVQYGRSAMTHRNEEVKSYSEKNIADYFSENQIRYEYEPGIPGLYADPDFYLPEYDVYVEFWGLVDADDDNTAYRYEKSMKRKMAIYHTHNIKFISIYPRNLENLDWVFRKKFEKVTGKKLPKASLDIQQNMLTCYNCGMYYDASSISLCPNCGSAKRINFRV